MLPSHRVPTHPGEVLQEEFLSPLGVTQVALAEHIGVSVQRINEMTVANIRAFLRGGPENL